MTLILVPGHLCDARLYAPQVERYPQARIADVTRDDSIAGMAERVLAGAPERFSLAGLSMGGMVAMEVMRQAPDRVRAACLIATDPTPAREKEVAWRAGMNAKGLDTFARTFAEMFFAHDAGLKARLEQDALVMMTGMGDALYERQCQALDTRPDLRAAMAECPVPTEIVVGTQDRICPPRLHEALAASMPNANLTVLEGCGHIVTLEQPEALGAVLAKIA